MHLQLAHIAGASKVIVSEPNEYRRNIAKELGAEVVVDSMKEDLAEVVRKETNGMGVDVIIMAIGVPALVNPTLKMCKKGGTVCLFAGFAGTGECTVEVNTIHYNEIQCLRLHGLSPHGLPGRRGDGQDRPHQPRPHRHAYV